MPISSVRTTAAREEYGESIDPAYYSLNVTWIPTINIRGSLPEVMS